MPNGEYIVDIALRIAADGLIFVIALMTAFLFIRSIKNNHYQAYIRAFMAGLTAYWIAKIMSLFYQTYERPFILLKVEPKATFLDNPGFPSDHALFVMTLVLIIVAVSKQKTSTIALLFGLVFLVGIGRILALVHTPQDILGGYAAAFIGVGIWYRFFTLKTN